MLLSTRLPYRDMSLTGLILPSEFYSTKEFQQVKVEMTAMLVYTVVYPCIHVDISIFKVTVRWESLIIELLLLLSLYITLDTPINFHSFSLFLAEN